MTETENGLVKKTSSQDFLSYFSVVSEKIVSPLHERRAPYYMLINRYVPIKVHEHAIHNTLSSKSTSGIDASPQDRSSS